MMKVACFSLKKHGAVMAMIVLSLASVVRSAVPENPFLGIPPQEESYYKVSSDTIKCKDGSNNFAKLQLNDDFCDCPDATDEPGTSACPSGSFYCRNSGHTPLFLFSSRVNDGICDCCDGSDEYYGTVKCQNTCWEAGKVARDKLKKKIATYKEGVALRKKEVEQAKVAFAKDEAELSKLKNEEKILKDLVQQLKERKEQIEKAEEKERLQREKEEKERKETEEKANKEKSEAEAKHKQKTGKTDKKTDHEDKPMENAHDHIGVLEDSSPDRDTKEEDVDPATEAEHSYASESTGTPVNAVEQHAAAAEEKSTSAKSKDETVVASETNLQIGSEESNDSDKTVESDASKNTEALSREELGRLVASRWTGSLDKQADEVDNTKDNDHEDNEDHEDMPPDTHDEEYDTYASDTDDDSGKYDDIEDDVEETYEQDIHDNTSSSYKPESNDELDFSDTSSPSSSSWLEKIRKTVRSILRAVNLFQTPVDKSEAAHIRKEYEESNSKLSKIQSRISSLTQKLKHDFGSEKEFYSFYDHCFEGKQNKYVYKVCPFKQASQMEGQSTTRLGRWDKFEDSYHVMVFSNGDKCWNGPDRSLKVKLRCGLKNEITDVEEPSRCEYVTLLSTPALCLEEKLKELEDKLELQNREEPQMHDEL